MAIPSTTIWRLRNRLRHRNRRPGRRDCGRGRRDDAAIGSGVDGVCDAPVGNREGCGERRYSRRECDVHRSRLGRERYLQQLNRHDYGADKPLRGGDRNFTANSTAGGPYTVSAAVSAGPSANFALTNTAGAATTMTANAGTTPQSATISTAFAVVPAVTVKDAGNNPVSGVNVTFTAPASGASGMFSNSTNTITVATDPSGVASAPFTANATAGGPYTVRRPPVGLRP